MSQEHLPEQYRPLLADPKHRLGRYLLIKKIGKGGQSEVWRAWDLVLPRYVAVKILNNPDAEDLVRFKREANIVANLHHPNIAPVFALEQEGDRHFIAMQLVDGDTIDRLNAPLPKKLAHLRDAARALHFAHSKGIVHRDVKPSNMMIATDGTLFLLDFGIARPVKRGATITETQFLVGTPAYMAPEQALGGRVDERTDVYALGATLYRLATNSDPYYGDDPMAVLLKVTQEAPPRPRTLEPGLPKPVEDIVRIAMSRSPETRYKNAAEMADQIDAYLSGQKVRAAPRDPIKVPTWFWVGVASFLVAASVLWAATRGNGAAPPVNPPLPGPPPAATDYDLEAARKFIDALYQEPNIRLDLRNKRVQEAREALDRTLTANPDNAPALLERARLHLFTGNLEAAFIAADRSVAADPDSPTARLMRARLAVKRGLSRETRRIAALDPAAPGPVGATRVSDDVARGSPEVRALLDLAAADLKAFRPPVGSPDAAFASGLAHFAAGRFSDASLDFKLAADSVWVGPDARLLAGLSSYVLGDFGAGEVALAQTGSGEDVVEARLLLAMLVYLEGARRFRAGTDPNWAQSLLKRNFDELKLLRPNIADWTKAVPLSKYWRVVFSAWVPQLRGR